MIILMLVFFLFLMYSSKVVGFLTYEFYTFLIFGLLISAFSIRLKEEQKKK